MMLSVNKTGASPSKNNLTQQSTTKPQIEIARNWVDTQLPMLYDTHITDKIDVTTLQKMTLQCLDKSNLTAASKAYAVTLCQCLTYAKVTTTAPKTPSQSTHGKKVKPAELTFEPSDFLSLQPANHPSKTADTANSKTPQNTKPGSTNTNHESHIQLQGQT